MAQLIANYTCDIQKDRTKQKREMRNNGGKMKCEKCGNPMRDTQDMKFGRFTENENPLFPLNWLCGCGEKTEITPKGKKQIMDEWSATQPDEFGSRNAGPIILNLEKEKIPKILVEGNMKKCQKCGNSVEDKLKGHSGLKFENSKDGKLFGKYSKYKILYFCIECWLDSLMN